MDIKWHTKQLMAKDGHRMTEEDWLDKFRLLEPLERKSLRPRRVSWFTHLARSLLHASAGR